MWGRWPCPHLPSSFFSLLNWPNASPTWWSARSFNARVLAILFTTESPGLGPKEVFRSICWMNDCINYVWGLEGTWLLLCLSPFPKSSSESLYQWLSSLCLDSHRERDSLPSGAAIRPIERGLTFYHMSCDGAFLLQDMAVAWLSMEKRGLAVLNNSTMICRGPKIGASFFQTGGLRVHLT